MRKPLNLLLLLLISTFIFPAASASELMYFSCTFSNNPLPDSKMHQVGLIASRKEIKRSDITVPFTGEQGTFWVYQTSPATPEENTWLMFDFVIYRLTGQIYSKEKKQHTRVDDVCKKLSK